MAEIDRAGCWPCWLARRSDGSTLAELVAVLTSPWVAGRDGHVVSIPPQMPSGRCLLSAVEAVPGPLPASV
ncbi:hypothetical protein ACQEVB_38780 [Pseudonocardia sp. CA-107938]|uniref:hypothetical protein n=1 Tax=Pseudonocardia sp. CA-107938 TaxID=3240021 RepID=UPI003D8D48CF